VTEVTYYRWRNEYGGLKGDQVKRLKELEIENSRLRRAVSDLTLDKLILAEAANGAAHLRASRTIIMLNTGTRRRAEGGPKGVQNRIFGLRSLPTAFEFVALRLVTWRRLDPSSSRSATHTYLIYIDFLTLNRSPQSPGIH
jgi:hypothetical protein